MRKYHGEIGYALTVEKAPGVWVDDIVEKKYYGTVLNKRMRWDINRDSINDNLTVNSEFSILADAFAFENFGNMRYIKYMGVSWKISSIEVKRPRIIITVGGVWNGEQA